MRLIKFYFLLLFIICFKTLLGQQNFKIENGSFQLNGKEIQLICGEMHYTRIPREYWRDRLKRARAMGLNTISTYVFWNFHERKPGIFDFKGQADLSHFIKLAQEEGLYILLRPGPYVCAEWDFGGYPYWLLNEKGMIYRSQDEAFLKACNRYIQRLGKELARQTIQKGGNIIMVQLENEYGSYGNDKVYLNALKNMIQNAGFDTPLLTCDGGGQMGAGHLKGVFPAINGVLGNDIFKIVDRYQPGGPYFVAEFYPAWFDVWGKKHSKVDYKHPTEQLEWMLKNKISVSMYMFHGGTNFWYTNGANTAEGYAPQPTSYDYDAPLGEWGNCYPKYYAFRDAISKYLPKGESLPDVPADNPTISFPKITMEESAPLQAAFHKRIKSEEIQTMEEVEQDFGYIHYETILQQPGKGKLILHDLRDYAVVLLNGKQIGSLDRRHNQNILEMSVPSIPAKLEIIVENTGRVNYGPDILHNHKGITEKVLWLGQKLKTWTITSLPLYREKVGKLTFSTSIIGVPAFHKGTIHLQYTGDCFLDMSAWGKGAAWVNGHSLGRFWNIGPQQTLYVPAPWLKKGKNEIVIFEMEDTGNRNLQGLKTPILDQVGTDKNQKEKPRRDTSRTPILDNGDIILEQTLKLDNEWQFFKFPTEQTIRHFCIETLSAYNQDGEACLLEIDMIDDNGTVIDKADWRIVHASSEYTDKHTGIAENLIDGDISSFWHTQLGEPGKHPHCVIIDMNTIYKVKSIRIRSREGAFLTGRVKDFRIYARPQFFLFNTK